MKAWVEYKGTKYTLKTALWVDLIIAGLIVYWIWF